MPKHLPQGLESGEINKYLIMMMILSLVSNLDFFQMLNPKELGIKPPETVMSE